MAGINLMDRHMAIAAIPHIENQNGSITFTKKALAMPVKKMLVDIESVQSGSGDPSPDNVRPISGWTGAKVTRTGKNLFQTTLTTTVERGVTYTVNTDGTISLSGTATEPYSQVIVGRISLAAGSYLISDGGIGSANNEMYISGIFQASTKLSGYFVLNEAITDRKVYYYVEGGTNVTGKVIKPMICLASAPNPTIFAPYTGTTIPISWQSVAGTVYGGTLDVTTGLLTVDRAIVDLGTLNYSEYGSTDTVTQYYTADLDVLAKDYSQCIVSDVFVYSEILAPWTCKITRPNGKTYFKTPKDQYSSPASFKAALSGAQLVYELATPQTYQLTPTEVKLLLGDNNVWADTGDITMKFWSH